jgi:acyl-CoA synthetase (AMP-forming)/AMP-acid ligase II
MFTSGTTGPQKAVPQTFKNHYASALGCKESLGFDQQTTVLYLFNKRTVNPSITARKITLSPEI